MTLFEKYPLHQLNLANRIVMAPMTRSRATNPDAKADDLIALYYAQRATAGLLISEGTAVSAEAIGYVDIPGIYTPSQIEGWKLVTDKVHRNEGVIFAQLWHVGRVSHPDVLGGSLPLAPSAVNPNIQVYTKNGYCSSVCSLT